MSRRSAADVPKRGKHDRRHGAHDVAERQETSRTEHDKYLYTDQAVGPSSHAITCLFKLKFHASSFLVASS